ncbi:hypothetical protein [Mesorhizobium sp. WSM4313]|uniref:hypothetical protein n=1 Tax=Mesorhizobium sp. WSM4313 TaxID=2029412 RepID=UPI000BD169D9|nr:hypothetical protein [Mesorhizobium sp. WSM4313]PBB20396.1 hypothetical protein CK219_10515 [Mesorhizobium sp. WSM4313]
MSLPLKTNDRDNETPVSVAPYVRILPTGVVRNDKGIPKKLKATLLITPDLVSPGTNSGELTFDLATWPLSVHGWLADGGYSRVALAFADAHDGRILPTPCTVKWQELSVRLPKVKGLASSQITTLNRLWQETIFLKSKGGDQTKWTKLATAIAASLGKGATQPGKIAEKEGDVAGPSDDKFGEDGQLLPSRPEDGGIQNGTRQTVESVVQVPHADMALALEFQHAAELCMSLKEACGDPVDRRAAQQEQTISYDFDVALEQLEQRADEEDISFAIKLVTGRPLRAKEERQPDYIQRLNKDAKWNGEGRGKSDSDRLLAVLTEAETKGALNHIRRQKLRQYKKLQESLSAQRDNARKAYELAAASVNAGASSCVTSPEGVGWSTLKPVDAADPGKREKHIRDSLDAHALSTWPQYRKKRGTKTDISIKLDEDRDALSAFFAIQTTPSLARAFLLALDIEIDINSIPEPAKRAYGFLSASLSSTGEGPKPVPSPNPVPWTLTKFLERQGGWHFWPTTVTEFAQYRPTGDAESAEICANSVSQFDGVLMMSRGHSCEPKSNNSRYDVTSMDIRTVAELEMQRRLLRGAESDEPLQREFSDLDYAANRQTTGLTLLCRSAQNDAVARMAMRVKKAEPGGCVVDADGSSHVVLDAEDLTIGFRLAVGVPMSSNGTWTTEWRPLKARQIEFGTSGHKDRRVIEGVLSKLVGLHTSRQRIALDSSFHTVPARLMPTADGNVEASVEQAVCVWDGGPMGVDCSAPDETTGYVLDSLGFGRTLSVPTTPDITLPRLRYGYPYRFAMMAVYSGGASLELDDLERQVHTDGAATQRFYPPDSCKGAGGGQRIEPYVRALRQTKLAAPEVLLPGGHATRQIGPMGYEVARNLVVRSVKSESKDRRLTSRAVPVISQRIVIAPGIALSEAARHWDSVTDRPVLDSVESSTTPAGAFPQIEQGGGSTRFPVVKTSVRTGIDGRRHIDQRTVVLGQSDGTVRENEEISDAVFRTGGSGRSSYYPDPAADRMAIGLRFPGSKDYIGAPLIVALGEGRRYPDRLPIVLTLRQQQRPRAKKPSDIREVAQMRQTRFDPDSEGDITSGWGKFQCHEVTLTLAPNETFLVDVWCVPTAERLTREFAVLQGLAQYLAQCGQADAALDPILAGACSQLPESLKPLLQAKKKTVGSISYIGPGSAPVPDIASIRAVAQAVEQCLCKSPLPELVGLQSLTVNHACNRPDTKPEIAQLGSEVFDTGLVDPTVLSSVNGLSPIRAFRPPPNWRYRNLAENGGVQYNSIPVAAVGSTNVFLSGDVGLDLKEIDTIEVIAKTALPTSGLFDSKLRKRSTSMKRAGEWPMIPSTSAEKGQQPVPGNPGFVYKGVEDIFGFQVFPDGRVCHRQAEVVLLRAENLPLPGAGLGAGGKISLEELFAMLAEQEAGTKPPVEGLRLLRPHKFNDGKARIMEVRVNGLARSLDMLRTANRVAKAGDAWLSGNGLFYLRDELVPSENIAMEDQSNFSRSVTVILPATGRPAKCDARAPAPVFQWKEMRTPFRLIRRRDSVVRIPLGREWFSSGQGERLGIVLWPPNLLLGDTPALDKNQVPIRGTGHYGVERVIDLTTFADADLGPGGAFITRRGADPIEDGPPQTRIFMSQADFPDLLRPSGDLMRATFVGEVDMPLADDGSEMGTAERKQTKGSDEAPQPPLRVALVTYEPRFDVEREEWYVDVRLRDGETASPFVRFGLVRYQPNTHRALRCSRPMVQWVKPLPKRYVSIRPSQDQRSVEVTMVGRAATGRCWPSVVNPSDAEDANLPSMRVALFEDYLDSGGRQARRFHQFLTNADDRNAEAKIIEGLNFAYAKTWKDGSLLVKPSRTGFGATNDYASWQTTIPLEGAVGQYKLHVEEVEHFLPASFDKEPVTEKSMLEEGNFVQAGPRLAVTFELFRQPVARQGHEKT